MFIVPTFDACPSHGQLHVNCEEIYADPPEECMTTDEGICNTQNICLFRIHFGETWDALEYCYM